MRKSANRRIYGLGKRSFVALGLLQTDDHSRTLGYVVAGQPPPLVRRLDGRVEELPLGRHRLPVGSMPKSEYQRLEVELDPGELVLAYSDGVTDARSPEGEFYGEERLIELVSSMPAAGPDALVAAVLSSVGEFTRDAPLYDDVTLLAVLCRAGDGGTAEDPR